MREKKQEIRSNYAIWLQKKFYSQNPDYENNISWVIKELFSTRQIVEDPYMLDSESADKDIKYCPVCDYCWEKPKSGKSSRSLITYKNFPRMGKEKMECPHCRGEMNLDFLCSF
jgi:hypothetical protein